MYVCMYVCVYVCLCVYVYIVFVAPNSPEGLTVDTRTSTSVTISWSPVVYTDKIYSIQKYQVGNRLK